MGNDQQAGQVQKVIQVQEEPRCRKSGRFSASSHIPKKEGAKNITFFLSSQNGHPQTAFELSKLYSYLHLCFLSKSDYGARKRGVGAVNAGRWKPRRPRCATRRGAGASCAPSHTNGAPLGWGGMPLCAPCPHIRGGAVGKESVVPLGGVPLCTPFRANGEGSRRGSRPARPFPTCTGLWKGEGEGAVCPHDPSRAYGATWLEGWGQGGMPSRVSFLQGGRSGGEVDVERWGGLPLHTPFPHEWGREGMGVMSPVPHVQRCGRWKGKGRGCRGEGATCPSCPFPRVRGDAAGREVPGAARPRAPLLPHVRGGVGPRSHALACLLSGRDGDGGHVARSACTGRLDQGGRGGGEGDVPRAPPFHVNGVVQTGGKEGPGRLGHGGHSVVNAGEGRSGWDLPSCAPLLHKCGGAHRVEAGGDGGDEERWRRRVFVRPLSAWRGIPPHERRGKEGGKGVILDPVAEANRACHIRVRGILQLGGSLPSSPIHTNRVSSHPLPSHLCCPPHTGITRDLQKGDTRGHVTSAPPLPVHAEGGVHEGAPPLAPPFQPRHPVHAGRGMRDTSPPLPDIPGPSPSTFHSAVHAEWAMRPPSPPFPIRAERGCARADRPTSPHRPRPRSFPLVCATPFARNEGV
ncbi:hypothetical protein EDB89DRAFT_1911918 [Lactarius sanguifluus]|nr:hypothetical protein EDB89DRAFT_1911918 [Lactarius sanguifluus]